MTDERPLVEASGGARQSAGGSSLLAVPGVSACVA